MGYPRGGGDEALATFGGPEEQLLFRTADEDVPEHAVEEGFEAIIDCVCVCALIFKPDEPEGFDDDKVGGDCV